MLLWPPAGPSREEIINAARQYGMVFREEVVPFALSPGPDHQEKPKDHKENPDNKDNLERKPEEILVTIPAGATLQEIAVLLEKQGVVAQSLFEAEARKSGVTGRIKAGSHYLPKGDVAAVLKRLTE